MPSDLPLMPYTSMAFFCTVALGALLLWPWNWVPLKICNSSPGHCQTDSDLDHIYMEKIQISCLKAQNEVCRKKLTALWWCVFQWNQFNPQTTTVISVWFVERSFNQCHSGDSHCVTCSPTWNFKALNQNFFVHSCYNWIFSKCEDLATSERWAFGDQYHLFWWSISAIILKRVKWFLLATFLNAI